MLAAIAPPRGWRFAAVGKHPVARDYLRVGEADPMINGFADWVESGYRALGVARAPAVSSLRSYRFFARGPGRDMLACGVLRDSGDAVGRPYPLLLMGCGPLGWEDAWDLLPLACEKTWAQMESVAAGAPGDLARFEAQVRATRPPDGDWGGLAGRRGTPAEAEAAIADRVCGHFGRPGLLFPLDGGASGDIGPATSFGFSRARAGGQASPNAVFMGGTQERTGLALYSRSLTASDFADLWAAGAPAAGGS